jgi:predicted O-methyltransferase YrrM
MHIPIYFSWGLKTGSHQNFPHFFEDLNYFKDREIKILHLGAYTGHATKWMLKRVNGSCVDVDLWSTDSPAQSNHEVEKYYSKIDFSKVELIYDAITKGLNTKKYKGTTENFFKQNKDKFDFIYVDACHDKKSVDHDLEESFKILMPGGVIACDDYRWEMDLDSELRPYEAIKEFVERHSQEVEIIIDNYQLWFKKVSM